MSNILIIKHGSLGDIVQISGVLRDIKEFYKDHKIFILTTNQYTEILGRCPYIDAVLIDRRLPRWNIFYLLKLRKIINSFNFSSVIDLQNSSRTSFYRKFIFNVKNWSCTATALKKGQKKIDFDQEGVLSRFKIQLENFGINANYSLKPNFSWAAINVDSIVNKFFGKKFVLIFPFSSPQLKHKQWPYYNQLVKIIKSKHPNIEIATAPGPRELDDAKHIQSTIITNKQKSLTTSESTGLIKKSSFVISNDTGPAHMAAHLGIEGVVLFGHHTTAKKVSIETEKFKALSVKNLNELPAEEVYLKIKEKLNLIN